jgi:hypothetical protein
MVTKSQPLPAEYSVAKDVNTSSITPLETMSHVQTLISLYSPGPASGPTVIVPEAALLDGDTLAEPGHACRDTLAEPLPLYDPASHAVQTPDPVPALYFPASQAVHVPVSAPEKPGLQEQTELPAGENVDDGHNRHTDAPAFVEYLPAAHSTHTPPVTILHAAVKPEES